MQSVSSRWPAFRWTISRSAEHEALPRGDAPSGLLSRREAETLAGLGFPMRRKKWLLGRVAAKRLLLEELRERRGLELPPDALTIGNEPSGAPYAELEGEGRLPWALSLSHRGELGLAALCAEPRVSLGVDLELVEPRDPALVRTFFTEAEQAAVAAGPSELTVARIWSAKEAVLKALGLGLRLDTRQVQIGGEAPRGGCPEGWTPLALAFGPQAPAAPQRPFALAWRNEGAFVLCVATSRCPGFGSSAPSGR